MAEDILGLEPKRVWYYFNEVCKIPHGSGNESGLRDYIVGVAKKLGLEYKTDERGNVVVRKPANNSKSSKTIVLQGHLDMVCEAEKGRKFDPSKDPIKPYADGDWIKAEGTSLGADNGIALAVVLALLESKDIEHGPLECLMTVEEETGLFGATALSSDMLKGKTMINMDTEVDDTLYVGCAGGRTYVFELPCKETPVPDGYVGLHISVSGLKGGHSGLEIHQQRGNANKILGRILGEIKMKCGLILSSFDGGTKHNVIPFDASATIAVKKENKEKIEKIIGGFIPVIKNELSKADPNCKIDFKTVQLSNVIEKNVSDKIINFINAAPHGVLKMSLDIEGLVQTSVNLAVVKMEKGKCSITVLARSSVESESDATIEQYLSLAELVGAKIAESNGYPGWQPNINSPILNLVKKVFKGVYNKEPNITAIHAGLECGVIGAKYPDIDMIAIGPELHDVHSPNEKLGIKSTQNFWKFATKILEEVARG